MKITRAQLKRIIKEEIEAVDEGFLDKIKGMFGGGSGDTAKYAEMFPGASKKQLARHAEAAKAVHGLKDFLEEIEERLGRKAYQAAYDVLTSSYDYEESGCSGDPWDCEVVSSQGSYGRGQKSAGFWDVEDDVKRAEQAAMEAHQRGKGDEKRAKERAEYCRKHPDSETCSGVSYSEREARRDAAKRERDEWDRDEETRKYFDRDQMYRTKSGRISGMTEARIIQKVEERMVRRLRKKK